MMVLKTIYYHTIYYHAIYSVYIVIRTHHCISIVINFQTAKFFTTQFIIQYFHIYICVIFNINYHNVMISILSYIKYHTVTNINEIYKFGTLWQSIINVIHVDIWKDWMIKYFVIKFRWVKLNNNRATMVSSNVNILLLFCHWWMCGIIVIWYWWVCDV